MTPRRLAEYGITVLALVASVLGLRVVAAYAQTTSGGSLDQGGVGADVSVPGGNGSNGSSNSATGGSSSGGTAASYSSGGGAAPTTSWARHFWGGDDPGYMTNAPIICPSGQHPYEDVQTDLTTGAVLQRVQGCTALPATATPVATTTPPPSPPTAAEARSLVPLPTPGFGVSPRGTGLTGLATYVWDSTAPGPVTATSTIRGYVVVSVARPVHWTWDMAATGPASRSNPPSIITSTRPGTEANPAGSYTYESRGEYGLTLDVVWGGSFTYSGNGVPAVTADLGTTTRSSSRSFAVTEVRPVLVAR